MSNEEDAERQAEQQEQLQEMQEQLREVSPAKLLDRLEMGIDTDDPDRVIFIDVLRGLIVLVTKLDKEIEYLKWSLSDD